MAPGRNENRAQPGVALPASIALAGGLHWLFRALF